MNAATCLRTASRFPAAPSLPNAFPSSATFTRCSASRKSWRIAWAEVDHASAEYAQIAERFHRIQAEIQARDGYTIESEVGTVLNGLGFKKEDWERRTEEFSGGWQMRIALAKLLLQKPNLLLLDEPTNHLDLETRNWLEQYLANYPHAYVLISHDRYFLDVTVKKTAEIWNKQVYVLLRQLREVSGAESRAPRAA